MTTVLTIVTRALKRIDVTAQSEAASADDAAYAIDTFNEMMHGWAAKGVRVNHTTQTSTSTFGLSAKLEAATIAVLALELADHFGATISAKLASDASDGWRAIQADYIVVEPMRSDNSLAFTPSQRRWYV